MLARTPEQKRKPYRLDSRQTLSSQPPFTVELTRKLLLAAMRGRAVVQLDEQAVNKLTATLLARHQMFWAAQSDRTRAARRAQVVKLFAELHQIMPEIIEDLEQQPSDFFARHTLVAAKALHRAIGSDVVERVLPPIALSDNITSWKWTGKTLHQDVAALIGVNGANRFMESAVPLLSGERPTAASIATWIKQQRKAA